MQFSSSETQKIIEMINRGKSLSYIKKVFGIEDADWLYEIKYANSDKIQSVDSQFFVARNYTNPTFRYGDRIIETINIKRVSF